MPGFYSGFSLHLLVFGDGLHLGHDIGQDKKLRIGIVFGQILRAFLRQFNLTVFLINRKIQGLIHQMHPLGLLLHIMIFSPLQCHFDAIFR